MRMTKQLSAPLLFILMAALLPAHEAVAQEMSVTGQWEFTVELPNGTSTRQATLVQTGDSISGTISSSRASGPVFGTVEDGKVMLMAELAMDTGPFTVVYVGELHPTDEGLTMFGTVDLGEYAQGTFQARKVEGSAGSVWRAPPPSP